MENGTGVVMREYGIYSCDEDDTLFDKPFEYFDEKNVTTLDEHFIGAQDVNHFTFNSHGNWCVICQSDNKWYGKVPLGMKKRLDEYTSKGEIFTSVCIAENDNWAVVTNKSMAGTTRVIDAAKKANELYGEVKSIALTDLGVVVCCERGVYYENIPTNVAEKIQHWIDNGWLPSHVSFTDSGTYFISNGKSGRSNRHAFYM